MMKSRNIIIKTLVIISAFLFISAAALSFGIFRANAEVPAGTFEIESSGVSLKLNETDGLRFVVKMDESIKNYVTENENVVLGFAIGPKQIMDNYTEWYGKNLLQLGIGKSTIYQVGEYWYANGCVTKINEVNRSIDYTAAAFILNGGKVEKYAAPNAEVYGNIYDIATRALLYPDIDYTARILGNAAYDWLGTESFPIRIKTLDRYNQLIEKINAGYDFGERVIEVSSSVDTSAATALASGKTLPAGLKTVGFVSYYVGENLKFAEGVALNGTATRPADEKMVAGQRVECYYTTADFAAGTEYDFNTPVTEDKVLYAKLSDYLYFNGKVLSSFYTAGGATKTLNESGTLTMSGSDGAYIARELLLNAPVVGNTIEIRAKKTGTPRVDIHVFGTYTEDGVEKESTAFGPRYRGLTTQGYLEGSEDTEGYRLLRYNLAYTVNGEGAKNIVYKTIKGIRIDFAGSGDYSLEIAHVKSVNGVSFEGEAINGFAPAGSTKTLNEDGTVTMAGTADSLLSLVSQKIKLNGANGIEVKVKLENVSRFDIKIRGSYVKDGVAGTSNAQNRYRGIATYGATVGEPDKDGYVIIRYNLAYANNSTSALDFYYNEVEAFRFQIGGITSGASTGSATIAYAKSFTIETPAKDCTVTYYLGNTVKHTETVKEGAYAPKVADEVVSSGRQIVGYYTDAALTNAFDIASTAITEDTKLYIKTSDYLYFNGAMISKFAGGNVTGKTLNDDGTVTLTGKKKLIHQKGLNLDLNGTNCIEIKAKADVLKARVDIYLFGTYTLEGAAGESTNYGQANTFYRGVTTQGWTVSEPDEEGYVIMRYNLAYTVNGAAAKDFSYSVIKGFRIDLEGCETLTVEYVKSVKV